MDREGMNRMEPQGIQNKRFWDDIRCRPNARGWVEPFSVWQGWDEFNQARYALHCVMIWRRIKLPPKQPLYDAEGRLNRDELHRGLMQTHIESNLRSFHIHLHQSAMCDRPRLP
jgi:hypothetical protein